MCLVSMYFYLTDEDENIQVSTIGHDGQDATNLISHTLIVVEILDLEVIKGRSTSIVLL